MVVSLHMLGRLALLASTAILCFSFFLFCVIFLSSLPQLEKQGRRLIYDGDLHANLPHSFLPFLLYPFFSHGRMSASRTRECLNQNFFR